VYKVAHQNRESGKQAAEKAALSPAQAYIRADHRPNHMYLVS
jgi:hypothetical protein